LETGRRVVSPIAESGRRSAAAANAQMDSRIVQIDLHPVEAQRRIVAQLLRERDAVERLRDGCARGFGEDRAAQKKQHGTRPCLERATGTISVGEDHHLNVIRLIADVILPASQYNSEYVARIA